MLVFRQSSELIDSSISKAVKTLFAGKVLAIIKQRWFAKARESRASASGILWVIL